MKLLIQTGSSGRVSVPPEKRFPINPVTHPANNEAECIFSASRSHTVRPGRRCIFPEQGDAVTRNEIHAIPFERNFENPLHEKFQMGQKLGPSMLFSLETSLR